MEAEPSASSPDAGGPQRSTRVHGRPTLRSCYNCHRRKIRCDKKLLCSSCSRVGKSCLYPPPGQPVRRPRRTTMAWVASRLSDLERFLPTAAEGPESSQPFSPSSATPPARAERSAVASTLADSEQFFGEEVLVQDGSRTQYFNEILLSRQQDIQPALTTTLARNNQLELRESSVHNPMGILSATSSTHTSSSFFPSAQTALRLWSIYLERVESCTTLKVLHVPTDEVRVCATIDDLANAQPENLALCFAIFYAAIGTLQPGETQTLLDGDLVACQSRYKAGFEQALAEAEILDNPTLTLLCALTIYLSALRIYNRGKGIWILNGLAIRIAQSMGLHRDGDRLRLPVFQAELRRRVWWHLLARDSRAAEDYGLQKLCNMRSDADLPLNLDDRDLYADIAELPPPRPGLTDITFTLIGYHIALAVQRLAGIVAASTPPSPPQESVRREIIDETRTRVEEWLQHCNPVIPRHRLALLSSRLALRKADLISRQQWLALNHPDSHGAFATEEDLVETLEVLELVLQMWNDEMLKPYSWMWRANPEYHIIMYLLWHLCVRPEGRNVNRAWNMVGRLNRRRRHAIRGGVVGAPLGRRESPFSPQC
ncbi:uncharacterized protein DNG_06868 [Cephalotrichum gorgonifer]|uniref:Zn(2)-C6 fungal-type domain-containing protein n=1 Tax=Cephalotrichum gorgonifer TaxID=2041049 RepID=A0AAE8SWV5_9PEZI|nr:uncharacterized protein DNG_06868 [Cephalotrichum gorgonifer]